MDFPASLSQQLSDLTDALDDPGTDLQTILAVLVDDLTAAVPSFLGLTMTLRVDGESVALTAIEADALPAARSSLQLPLDPMAGAGPGSAVVFYARDVDAFAELAADSRRLHGVDGQVLLDGHLPDRDAVQSPLVTDPAQGVVIHRAMGLLIDQGLTPEQAAHELRRRAAATGCALTDTAHHLLRTGAADLGPAP